MQPTEAAAVVAAVDLFNYFLADAATTAEAPAFVYLSVCSV